ncbi:hypothetical protein Taro_043785 [Colocasia esculenta]|uniref:Uncharacterized protein n=1 Tax=Colocasia esculenta TaxID=4460 RepID=A0A843WSY0_COLES|nr:hypothetical protein [Colocasia esculenta]
MVGGSSSSREHPGRSILEGQLASVAARAEDALAQLRERGLDKMFNFAGGGAEGCPSADDCARGGGGGATPTPGGGVGGEVAPGG